MAKRGSWALPISVFLVIALIIIIFFWFALFKTGNVVYYGQDIKNPADGLTIEEAILRFNEDFVFYLLYKIEAYNLHNPPLTKDLPKMEIIVGDDIYNAVIDGGRIFVGNGKIDKKDVVIRTTKEEIVKMMIDVNYVKKSFNDGKSSIKLVASKTTLFAKGYLNLYNKLIGNSITGNVVRMYLS
ncbi:MAG: hypothetical protein N3D20_03095 [Candidatus Pacearchaeota archaeon]|nr:hypothetical protein [Candidatus Pacearchaeota archaeon]